MSLSNDQSRSQWEGGGGGGGGRQFAACFMGDKHP